MWVGTSSADLSQRYAADVACCQDGERLAAGLDAAGEGVLWSSAVGSVGGLERISGRWRGEVGPLLDILRAWRAAGLLGTVRPALDRWRMAFGAVDIGGGDFAAEVRSVPLGRRESGSVVAEVRLRVAVTTAGREVDAWACVDIVRSAWADWLAENADSRVGVPCEWAGGHWAAAYVLPKGAERDAEA